MGGEERRWRLGGGGNLEILRGYGGVEIGLGSR